MFCMLLMRLFLLDGGVTSISYIGTGLAQSTLKHYLELINMPQLLAYTGNCAEVSISCATRVINFATGI